MNNITHPSGGEAINRTLEAMKAVASENVQELSAEQETSMDALKDSQQDMVNPTAARLNKDSKKLESQSLRFQKAKETSATGRFPPPKELSDRAREFLNSNPQFADEYTEEGLINLRKKFDPDDSIEDILRKLTEEYPQDIALAYKVLDYLLATSSGNLKTNLQAAKEQLYNNNKRVITAAENMTVAAKEAMKKGLGTNATTLRGMYYDFIDPNQKRDVNNLFEEFAAKYSYQDQQKVLGFLLHSLGSDLNSKGASIERGELGNLIEKVRTIQALQGFYRVSKQDMPLIEKQFAASGIPVPPQLNFENLAKALVNITQARYATSTEVLKLAEKLGIN